MGRDQFQGVTEQAKAGKHRLDDARVLLDHGRWRGAMYLAGYAVECLLKAKLMVRFGCSHLLKLEDELIRRGLLGTDATIFHHKLEPFLRLTGAFDRLKDDGTIWKAFNRVNGWIPAWRYSSKSASKEDATDFLGQVEVLNHWIEHNV